MKNLGIAVFACLILMAAAGCGRKPAGDKGAVITRPDSVSVSVAAHETPRPPAEPVLEPGKLYREYQADKREGALKFYGRMVTLKARAGSYKTDCHWSLLTFELSHGANGPEGVQCKLKPGFCKTASDAAPGKDVEITGRCQGFDGTFVSLDGCTFTVR